MLRIGNLYVQLLIISASVDTRDAEKKRKARKAYDTFGVSGSSSLVYRFALCHAGDLSGKNVLDIGSGQGVLTALLAKSGADVIGADTTPVFIKKAILLSDHEDVAPKPLYICCDAESLPIKEGVFDAVFSTETIEHLLYPEKLISGAARVLKNTGTFILTSPNNLGLERLYRKIFKKLMQEDFQIDYQTIEEARDYISVSKWLKRANFKIEKCYGYKFSLVRPVLFWTRETLKLFAISVCKRLAIPCNLSAIGEFNAEKWDWEPDTSILSEEVDCKDFPPKCLKTSFLSRYFGRHLFIKAVKV